MEREGKGYGGCLVFLRFFGCGFSPLCGFAFFRGFCEFFRFWGGFNLGFGGVF